MNTNQHFNHPHNGFESQHNTPPSYGHPNSYQQQSEWPVCDTQPGLSPNHNHQQQKPVQMQLKSHGTKHAFQVEETTTQGGWHTVSIESAAKLMPNDPNNKQFDWKAKTTFQLTRNELPIFIATMLGMLPYCKFSNHGDQNKWLEVENQSDHFYMKTGGAGIKIHVAPIPITEAYMFGCLALTQFVKNFGGMNESAAITIIDRMANQVFGSKQYQKALEQKGTGRN